MKQVLSHSHLEFLSYPLGPSTPSYGGGAGFEAMHTKCMEKGDSCNALHLRFPNHIGTHMDAPLHFVQDGKSVDMFRADELVFTQPLLIAIPLQRGALLSFSPSDFPVAPETDCLLIKTGFCERRDEADYIFDGPGLDDGFCGQILEMYPSLRCLMVDFISINRFTEREKGRAAHKILLSRDDFIIVEDCDFRPLQGKRVPSSILVVPLRIEGGDGSPVTVIGVFND